MLRHWKGSARRRAPAPCATSAPKDRCRQAGFFSNSRVTRFRCRPRPRESVHPAGRRLPQRPRWRRAGRPRTPHQTPSHRPAPIARRRAQHLFYRCLPPRRELAAHCGDCCARVAGGPSIPGCNRALDESTAQHTRLSLARVIKDAGLARRYTMLAIDQFHFATICAVAQPGCLWWAGRPDLHEDLAAIIGQRLFERTFADPVDVAQHDAAHPQRLTRTDNDTPPLGIKAHNVERCAGGNAETTPLTDRKMNDAGMAAQHFTVKIDDIAGLGRTWLQPFDYVGVVTGWNETDVLAVVLVGNCEPEASRELAGFGLGSLAEREAQNIKLVLGRAEKKIALVAFFVTRAVESPASAWKRTCRNLVTGREHIST